jgi:hypothetical protein
LKYGVGGCMAVTRAERRKEREKEREEEKGEGEKEEEEEEEERRRKRERVKEVWLEEQEEEEEENEEEEVEEEENKEEDEGGQEEGVEDEQDYAAGEIGTQVIEVLGGVAVFGKEQRKDEWLATLVQRLEDGELPEDEELKKKVLRNEHLYSVDGEGVLRRIDIAGLGRIHHPVVVPTHLVDMILFAMHEDPLAGHLGFTKTYNRIRERFWWDGLYTEAKEHVKTCKSCQTSKTLAAAESTPSGTDEQHQGYPGMTLQIDYTPAHRTPRGNSHILNIIDRFTRYNRLYATDGPKARATAELILDYISCFGCPVRIISDNGPEFIAELTRELMELLGVKSVNITPWNAKANSQVERPWRTLKEMLRSYINEKQTNWDVLLPLMQFAMNTAMNETTGYTPYFLQFGRRAVLPVEVHWDVTIQLKKKARDYVRELKENMKSVFELVRERVKEAQKDNQKGIFWPGWAGF